MKIIINRRTNRRSLWLAVLMIGSSVAPQIANATIVLIETNLGEIEVNLFDNDTPATVANFLFYVENGRFSNSIFHRAVPGFIAQGGGFTFDLAMPFDPVPAAPPVANEPVFSNLRGTIAMAKLGGDPNSATSQWYVNLANNSANLDAQNGGFTVFGQVTAAGMAVIDEIARLPRFNFGGAFGELPLQGFTGNTVEDITASNLVLVTLISVIDSSVDSAAGLNPVLNTSNDGGGSDPAQPPNDTGGGGGGGGGGFGLLSLFALLLMYRYRQA